MLPTEALEDYLQHKHKQVLARGEMSTIQSHSNSFKTNFKSKKNLCLDTYYESEKFFWGKNQMNTNEVNA